MSELKIGDKAPDFSLPANGGQTVSLSDYKGKKLILYFYPKDDTSGCTKEACSFKDHMPSLKTKNVAVVGVSKDSMTRHDKFITKYDLNFPLISDEDSDLCERYGTWVEKSMYGRKYMGIERSTFLIDEQGKIEQIWRKVKVDGHTEEILKAISKSASKAA